MTDGALHLDFESRATIDLTKVGAQRYAEHEDTRIILAAYRFTGEATTGWYGETPPQRVVDHVAAGKPVVAHSAAMERSMWNARIAPVCGVYMTVEQMDCTLARGQAMGLPASLEGLGAALKAPIQKDKEGHRLMMQMCKPIPKSDPPRFYDDEARILRLAQYCVTDVDSEVCVDERVPYLSDRERRIWILNQKFNDRGVRLDLPMVAKAQALVDYAKKRADDRMWRLTNGAVDTCGQTARIVAWLSSRGIACTSVADGETEELLAGAELFDDATAAEVVELRRSSVKAFKFKTMLTAACRDQRVRGTIAYHGAHTGRDAGRITQFQNMKRLDEDAGDQEKVRVVLMVLDQHVAVEDAYDALETILGDVLAALSVCARATIICDRGNKLVGGDFSNIEGRVAAYLAGAKWKLEAFRAFDAGTGPDLYYVGASEVLGKMLELVTKQERQEWGKVPELACTYQGALNAFKKMMAKYGMKIPDAQIHMIVAAWRARNVEIVAAWRELEDAVIDAVSNPGVIVPALRGLINYVVSGDFLYCMLPSGRVTSYAQPRCAWTKKTITLADGDVIEINKRAVSYWGTYKGRQMKLDLYGGAEFNHVTQGLARDILYDAALRVSEAGYELVLPVHDELVAEVPEGFGSADEFARMMSVPERYAVGIPLTTKAWEGPRYEH